MKKAKRIKVPPKSATNDQIVRFFRSHDPEKLLEDGIMAIDKDNTDLEEAMLSYLSEPRDVRVSIPLSRSAKRILGELARRKSVHLATLARIWIMEGLRREVLGAK